MLARIRDLALVIAVVGSAACSDDAQPTVDATVSADAPATVDAPAAADGALPDDAAPDDAAIDSDDATPAAITWSTTRYTMTADDFYIDAGGVQFGLVPQNLVIDGDPGHSTYMTVELTWMEHAVEMRMYIYLHADGSEWWSDEIRTYNGEADGDWIYYTGDFFRTTLGEAFTGDVDLTSDTPQAIDGEIHFDNLRFSAFE